MKLIKNPYFKKRGRGRRINNLRLLLMPKLKYIYIFSFQRSKIFYLAFEYHKQVQGTLSIFFLAIKYTLN